MDVREKIWKVAFELATDRPIDQISYADIAERAEVHRATVRRHVGSKQDLRAMLSEHQVQNRSNVDTRTRILDSATQIFSQYGYTGATLDEIAQHAGMTKGAVYWHFSSKSDLYLALCERTLNQQLHQLPNQIEDILAASDPAEALASWLLSQFQVCKESPETPMLFLEFITSSRESAIRERLQASFSNGFEVIGSFLQGLQERGLLAKDVSPKSVAVMINSLSNGVILSWLVDPESVECDQLIVEMSRVLWKGLEP